MPLRADYVPAQIHLYQSNHLLIHDVLAFDPEQAVHGIASSVGVMAIDLGGDKVRSAQYSFTKGATSVDSQSVHQALRGAGYLDFLQDRAAEAERLGLPVGISAAIRLDGSRVLRTTNLPVFHEEFLAAHDADFRRLFPGRSIVVNDTAAGIVGASVHLTWRGERPDNLVFFICGSGLGAAVIHQGLVKHVEAAHVPLVDALNPHGQTVHCHVEGKDFVCVERVTAMRSGIELLHEHLTGEHVSARELGRRADQGDRFAGSLFESSANALAHAIAGVNGRFDFAGNTVVVLHGGAFESSSYRARLARCIDAIPTTASPGLRFARDFSSNICLDGAAFLAASGIAQPETSQCIPNG